MNAARLARVDEIFAAYIEQDPPLAPGVAYGVVVDGQLVHAGGFGCLHVGENHVPGPDGIFRIASMTKSFVAATIILLRDEGVLRLDDRANQWVPELRDQPRPTIDSAAPTLRDLLSMRSGYPEDDAWADRLEDLSDDDFSALIATPKTHAWAVGVAFDYSNLGYTLLGRVIQNAAGKPFGDVITERILAPLGMHDTTWTGRGADHARLATGYARCGDEWIAQPVQEHGAFSALGGLYSTVTDLATWVAGFIDAWPPRNEGDTHPLCRASRRELQQVVTTMPLQLASSGIGALRIRTEGYCLGLLSHDDLATGRSVGHSGGYPGFGSHMRWHPRTGIGVIALANGRYARPDAAAIEVLAELVAAAPSRLSVQPLEQVAALRRAVDTAINAGELAQIAPLLADNVDLDESLTHRAATIARLSEQHGVLTPDGQLRAITPTQIAWWLKGERGRVGIEIMLNPEQPPRIQKLVITSVGEPNCRLQAAADAAVTELSEHDLAPLLTPVHSTAWVDGDGITEGTLFVEGPHATARIRIHLDSDHVAFVDVEPEHRWPTPW